MGVKVKNDLRDEKRNVKTRIRTSESGRDADV